MISKIILLGACGGFIKGFFILRRQKMLNQIFKDVEKMPLYNLDYMKSLNDLPVDKYILLCAKAYKAPNSIDFLTLSPNPTNILTRSFLITQPKKPHPDPEKPPLGRMWKSNNVNNLNLQLIGGENQNLIIRCEAPKKKEIIYYELPSFRTDITETEIEDIQSHVQVGRVEKFIKSNISFTEYGMKPDKHYIFCSKIHIDQETNAYKIKPLIILNESKENFLDTLDIEMFNLNRSAKIAFLSSLALFSLHLIIFKIFYVHKRNKESNVSTKD